MAVWTVWSRREARREIPGICLKIRPAGFPDPSNARGQGEGGPRSWLQ